MDDNADTSAGGPVEESHISTLAATVVSEPTDWKKKTPLKTYSKKVVSPSPPSGAVDPDAEGKSRFGRTRKLRPSEDFLSTDRKVSQYMKVHYEEQLANVRSTYSNSKTFLRPTHQKFGGPRSSLPAKLSSISSDAGLMNGSGSSEVVTSTLDLAAPTSTETVETPLDLQGCEIEEDADTSTNSEYQLGDLVWAAVPGYPFWPAMISRDPITNVIVKLHGARRKNWHVHFFGDRGVRGWVYNHSLFPFDLDTYNNKKNEALSVNDSALKRTDKKTLKQQKKLYTISDRYQHPWNSAVSEAQSLMETPRTDRLEYFEVTYLTKKEAKMRSWSSNVSVANGTPGKSTDTRNTVTPAKESKKRMRSWSSTLSLATDEKKPKRLKSDVPSEMISFMYEHTKKVEGGVNASPFKLPFPITSKSPKKALLMSRSKVVVKSIPARQQTSSTPPAPLNGGAISPTSVTTPALIAPLNSFTKKHPSPAKGVSRKKSRVSFKKSLDAQDATPPAVQRIASEAEKLFGVAPSPPTENQMNASSPAAVTRTPEQKKRGRPRKYPVPESVTSSPLTDLFPSLSPAAAAASPRLEKKHTKASLSALISPTVENAPAGVTVQRASPRQTEKQSKASLIGLPNFEICTADASAVAVTCIGNASTSTTVQTAPVGVEVKTEKDARASNAPSPSSPPTVTRSGRKSVKPEVLRPTFKTDKKPATAKTESPPPAPVVVKQEPSSPEGIEKVKKRQSESTASEKKVKKKKQPSDGDVPVPEIADLSKPAKLEIAPKVLPKKAFAIFTGVKDTKLCSVCFKGEKVVRCRGPCSLFMHVECGDKPRFVPGADHRESAQKSKKKRPGGPGRGKRKEIPKCESDDTVSVNGSIKEEIVSSADADSGVPDEAGGMTDGATLLHDDVAASVKAEDVDVVPSDDANLNGEGVKSEEQSNGSASPEQTNGELCPEQTNGPPTPEQTNGPPSPDRSNGSPCPEPVLQMKVEIGDQVDLQVERMFEEKPVKSCNGNGDDVESLPQDDRGSFPDTPPPEDNGKSPEREETPIPNGDVDANKTMEVNAHLLSDGVNNKMEVDDHVPSEMNLERMDAAESTTSESSEKEKNGCVSSKKDAKEKGWMCSLCTDNLLGPCFVCGNDEGERVRCKTGMCGKVFHLECIKLWPQHNLKQNSRGKMVFNCPAHTCHTCISDNPSCLTSRYLNDKLVRCMKCPTTYHHGNHCVPAGSEILTSTQIICPRHFRLGRKSLAHLNASWCFLCSMGGSLLCCDLCPTAFHVECLKISPPEGAYMCEDCETGRYPLYGEIVWVKLGCYRWWPARILFPYEVTPRLLKAEHVPGEFVVKFYGTYNCYWVNRGRVFLFHEGDGKKQDSINTWAKKAKDEAYSKGVREANEDFIIWNEKRNHLEESHRPTMKPPKFTKITSNKPVGSVKMTADADASSLTGCECNPASEDPCGPDSNCINRLLLVECHPETCPAKDKCNNRSFEKRLYPPLVAFRTENRGWGLKTVGPLKHGDFIIEYVGEMIDEEEYQRRLQEMQQNKDQNFYFLTLDKDRMLDAGPKGNLARFMNHSCQPNCETQKWTVDGDTRVGLFAVQDIPADSELVFDYNLTTTGDNKIECRCGAPNCTGYIGGKPTKPQPKPKEDTNNKNGRQSKSKKKRKTTKRRKNLAKIALTNSSLSASSKAETPKCSMCNENGATITCHEAQCSKMYHLACTHLTKEPKQYICPSHECSTCRSRSQVENCSLCINSYCSEHQEGNMVISQQKGPLCRNCNESDSGSEWSMGGKDEETPEPSPLASGT